MDKSKSPGECAADQIVEKFGGCLVFFNPADPQYAPFKVPSAFISDDMDLRTIRQYIADAVNHTLAERRV